jgi:hypothetical protein
MREQEPERGNPEGAKCPRRMKQAKTSLLPLSKWTMETAQFLDFMQEVCCSLIENRNFTSLKYAKPEAWNLIIYYMLSSFSPQFPCWKESRNERRSCLLFFYEPSQALHKLQTYKRYSINTQIEWVIFKIHISLTSKGVNPLNPHLDNKYHIIFLGRGWHFL